MSIKHEEAVEAEASGGSAVGNVTGHATAEPSQYGCASALSRVR
jgi:hypothetical protein